MIAIVAVRATVWPNVGPIESKLKVDDPELLGQRLADLLALGGLELLGGDLEAVVALDLLAAEALDLGVGLAHAAERVADAVLVRVLRAARS